MMITVTEYPHRGDARTWTASSETDFVDKVCAKLDLQGRFDESMSISSCAPIEQFSAARAVLADDLRSLDIERAK
jgi:hypothetical protein